MAEPADESPEQRKARLKAEAAAKRKRAAKLEASKVKHAIGKGQYSQLESMGYVVDD